MTEDKNVFYKTSLKPLSMAVNLPNPPKNRDAFSINNFPSFHKSIFQITSVNLKLLKFCI